MEAFFVFSLIQVRGVQSDLAGRNGGAANGVSPMPSTLAVAG
ncbi:hypothetical protein RMSM_02281 [Rhodopirellula maiorica SM1]|uniref:Uncharacterized protein n=1 Tax=Rhodopirellula maiorica SM1 TaxID=1265738 RepID=M5S3Q7_9BACT|nr:hypothetical protein RMSM_02281 [Rhodopirellula maiorica SM1]